MNDQEVIERLRSGLDELTSAIGDDVPVLDAIDDASQPRHGPRRWLVLSAAGLLIVVAAAGVWLAVREQRPDGTAATDTTPAAPTSTAPVERLPVPPTPEGWKVIEFGDVRLSVPPGWETTRCGSESEPGTVTLCGGGEDHVTVGPGSLDSGAGNETLNGLRVVTLIPDCVNDQGESIACDAVELIDLDVRVAPETTDFGIAQAILDSVGVSGRWRAAHEPLPAVPEGWQEFQAAEGVTFSVPPDWTTLDLQAAAAAALCPGVLRESTVVVGDAPPVPCPPPPPDALGELVEGVRVEATTQLPGPTTGPVWDEVVDVDGTRVTVRVGFGEDSQTAMAIIGSIHAREQEPTIGNTVPGSTTPATPATAAPNDVVGTWIVTRQERSVDDAGSQMFVPMASPLPTHRFDDDGTVTGFDGCNFEVAPWSFTDGRFTTTELTNATAAASTIGCEDSDGNPLPTVGPSPERLELIDGTVTMVFSDDDGITAHAQRLSDLPTPQGLAESSWTLAVDGPDVTVHFGRDGAVEFREDTTACAAGQYTYNAGVLVLDLDAALHQCTEARLDELTASPLDVASFSDDYMADTILLVPATGGAVRLFPESASTSTEVTARGDSSDTSTANTVDGAPDAAVWVLKPAERVSGASQSFTALVTRLDCNGGVTGEVLEPTVEVSDTEIVVTFTVEAAPGGDCPSNDQVPFVVDVGQPIGDRRLIDGSCRPTGAAASTSYCEDGGVRN